MFLPQATPKLKKARTPKYQASRTHQEVHHNAATVQRGNVATWPPTGGGVNGVPIVCVQAAHTTTFCLSNRVNIHFKIWGAGPNF